MLNPTKHVNTILLTTTAALIIALAATSTAQAHRAKVSSCDRAWQVAPAGQKWAAKQRCLAAVKRHNCVVHYRPSFFGVTVKGQRLTRGGSSHWRNQRHVIAWLAREASRRNLPYVVALSAIATTTQESSARELAGGHGTSVGPFQLIDLHGSAIERQTIEFSGNWFYNGAIRVYRANRAIDAVTLSHRVQRSAYPTAVARWIPEARRTLRIVLGPCTLDRR